MKINWGVTGKLVFAIVLVFFSLDVFYVVRDVFIDFLARFETIEKLQSSGSLTELISTTLMLVIAKVVSLAAVVALIVNISKGNLKGISENGLMSYLILGIFGGLIAGALFCGVIGMFVATITPETFLCNLFYMMIMGAIGGLIFGTTWGMIVGCYWEFFGEI